MANLLKRYKWRDWQHTGMNLPLVIVQNDKGERFEIAAEELPIQFNGQIQSWDLSFEGEVRSDYVAGLRVATSGAKRYVVDTVHEKLDFTQTIRAIQAFRSRHPETSAIWIENRANGAAAISILSHQIPGICKVSPSKSKYDWPFASSDELNAGNWYVPHPQLAFGSRLSRSSLWSFPWGKHDDVVDAWTQAREMRGGADYSMFTSALRVASFPIIPPGLRNWDY